MNARKVGRQSHYRGSTALAGPENHHEPEAAAFDHTTGTRNVSVAGTPRRWNRKPRTTSTSDIAAWALFTILTAASLLALSLLITIAWPS
jgi:hypothetical protein